MTERERDRGGIFRADDPAASNVNRSYSLAATSIAIAHARTARLRSGPTQTTAANSSTTRIAR